MKSIYIARQLCLNTLLYISCALYAQEVAVDEYVKSEIQSTGKVMVLIKLKENTLRQTSKDNYLLKMKQLQNSVLSVLSEPDFQLRYQYQSIPGFSGMLFESGLTKLASHPEVASIQMDMEGQGGLAESVPAIQADVVQNMGFTGKNVVVGVIDTGVNANHPDFNNSIVHEYHFLNQGSDVGPGATDQHGHGSNVAGIITSDGIVAPRGVAPDAKIVAIRVLDANNRGWVSDWIAGIDYIVANNQSLNVKIINMSLVTDAQYSASNCDFQQSLFAASVAAARNQAIVIFASSGNRGSTTSMTAPACLSEVMAVGAVYDSDLGREPNSGTYNSLFGGTWPNCFDSETSSHKLACFTSRNASLDLVAPGARITSIGRGFGTSTFRGTSQASPHAAGVAALLLEASPSLTRVEIITILKNSSVMVNDPQTGLSFPLLNAREAVGQVTSIQVSSLEQPETFILEQNYPNPVRRTGRLNNHTVIRYFLPTNALAKLTVFNILGQEVKQLVNGFVPRGVHQVPFNSIGLPGGLYFYKLDVGSSSQIRKFIILP